MKNWSLIVFVLLFTTTANARGLKLYIGTVEKQETQYTRFFLQLIVCNNTHDTVFIEKQSLENLYPIITDDVSEIGDGGSFFLINNVTNLITDNNDLMKLTQGAPPEVFDRTLSMEKKQSEENAKLPKQTKNNIEYYVFAPNKCLTINSMSQGTILEFLKLHDVTEEQQKQAKVNLAFPVNYHSAMDKTKRTELLISRESDALKKCVFSANNAEEDKQD